MIYSIIKRTIIFMLIECEFICSQLKTCDECFASFCNCCYDNLVTEQPCYVATENTTCVSFVLI